MKVTITRCDWCKSDMEPNVAMVLSGHEYDICKTCQTEMELKLAGPVPPVAAPVAATPKATKGKAGKKGYEITSQEGVEAVELKGKDWLVMTDYSAFLAKSAGLDMRLGDQAALHEGILRDHAGITYPSLEAMQDVYDKERQARPILFQGDLAHHKEALKSILETFGVDFSTLDGRKTASEMKATLELEGVTLAALPEFVEQHINVGF